MAHTMTKMPSIEEVRAELENRFQILLSGRVVDRTNRLTQWSPLYIDVSWFPETCSGYEGYHLTVAKNETTPVMYRTAVGSVDSLEEVCRVLSRYCKRQEAQQMRMF